MILLLRKKNIYQKYKKIKIIRKNKMLNQSNILKI